MYTPFTVTLYNAETDPITLAVSHNITTLEGVFLDISKAAHIEKTGLSDSDGVTLFIPSSVKATDPTTGAVKQYLDPKAYHGLSTKTGYWTLEAGGKDSSLDCFFVKGTVVSTNGYKYLRENYDYVFDVTTVDIRDFGSPNMHHWQVGAR